MDYVFVMPTTTYPEDFHLSKDTKARTSLRLDVEVCLEEEWRKRQMLLILVSDQCLTGWFHGNDMHESKEWAYGTAMVHGKHGWKIRSWSLRRRKQIRRPESIYNLRAKIYVLLIELRAALQVTLEPTYASSAVLKFRYESSVSELIRLFVKEEESSAILSLRSSYTSIKSL